MSGRDSNSDRPQWPMLALPIVCTSWLCARLLNHSIFIARNVTNFASIRHSSCVKKCASANPFRSTSARIWTRKTTFDGCRFLSAPSHGNNKSWVETSSDEDLANRYQKLDRYFIQSWGSMAYVSEINNPPMLLLRYGPPLPLFLLSIHLIQT